MIAAVFHVINDRVLENQQAVRQAGAVRRRLVPAERGREGRPGRSQRIGQDHAVPNDCRRGAAGRGRGVGSAQGDRRLLPPGRRRDVGPLGIRRGDCRQRTSWRAPSRARRASARDVRSRRRPARWTRFSSASASYRKSTSTWVATRSKAVLARSCTVSDSTTSGSTATLERCRAAGKCASRWRACCWASPTSC